MSSVLLGFLIMPQINLNDEIRNKSKFRVGSRLASRSVSEPCLVTLAKFPLYGDSSGFTNLIGAQS